MGVQQHRQIEQLGNVAPGCDRGVQVADQPGQHGTDHAIAVAAAVSVHDSRDPFPYGLDRLSLPARAIVGDRQQREPHRVVAPSVGPLPGAGTGSVISSEGATWSASASARISVRLSSGRAQSRSGAGARS